MYHNGKKKTLKLNSVGDLPMLNQCEILDAFLRQLDLDRRYWSGSPGDRETLVAMKFHILLC